MLEPPRRDEVQSKQAHAAFFARGASLFYLKLRNTMQPKLVHRDESAWEKGDLAYDLNDTLEMGAIKAEQVGIRPGSNGYAAFITAFARRVRSGKLSAKKASPQNGEAVVLTPDFLRSAG
jgi:hypothetical protein